MRIQDRIRLSAKYKGAADINSIVSVMKGIEDN